ncbi:MAG: lysylphosphatidylglycerol synthase transmembrane domain-containing protein [Paracoccaceae bacterium]|nr:lysylphosphatidylglycerol synthase transmembrane domain-containing protein [Paracoccaceae bacterium]
MIDVNDPPGRTPTATAPEASRRWRDIALLGGLFVLVLAGLAGLAAATGWEETLAGLSRISLAELGILLALSLVNYLLRAVRWHLFARKLGLPTSFTQDARHFLGGFAMSVTPGRVGELIRMRWLRRETGWSFERTAPLVLVDRASDLAAMGLLLAVALAFSTTGIGGAIPVVLLALGAAFVATRPRLLRLAATLGHRLLGLGARLFARVRRASHALEAFQDPTVMVAAICLGLIGWAAEGYAFWLLLDWMGAETGIAAAMAIFLFATLAGGLTGAPGGVGGAEAAMVALLTLEGVPLEISVPATLIIRVTTLWFAIGIGLAIFPMAERLSQRKKHVLEAG